jgi:hypothetical protein
LRWKLACYAAALAVVATLAGAMTTWTVMHFSEIAALDRAVAREARQFFESAKNSTQDPSALQEKLAPIATSDRFVELRDGNGTVIYRSANLRDSQLQDGIEKTHVRTMGGREVRIAEFRDGNPLNRQH